MNGARLWIDLGPVERPARRVPEDRARHLHRRLPGRDADAADERPTAHRLPSASRRCRTSCRCSRCSRVGDAHRRAPQRPRHGAPLLRHLPDDALRRDRAAQLRPHRPRAVRGRRRSSPTSCSGTSRRGSTSGSTRSPIRSAPASSRSARSTRSGAAALFGEGLGQGLVTLGGGLTIPFVHTDFIFTAVAEELGLLGAFALLGFAAVLVFRGLRIAALARDDFSGLLAVGLTASLGLQTLIIIGGNTKLDPAHRHHAAVRELRRLERAGQLHHGRPAAGDQPPQRDRRRCRAHGLVIATNVRRLGLYLMLTFARRLRQHRLVAGDRGAEARRRGRTTRRSSPRDAACRAGRSSTRAGPAAGLARR